MKKLEVGRWKLEVKDSVLGFVSGTSMCHGAHHRLARRGVFLFLPTSNVQLPTQKGFTLLELLVVLVIASVILAAVGVRFSGALEGLELKKQARHMMTELRRARSQALSKSQEVRVTFLQENSYQIEPDGKLQPLPQGFLLNFEPGPGAEDMPVLIQSEPGVWFYPDGSSSGGEVNVSSVAGSLNIRVDWLTGGVSVVDEG